MWTTPVIFLSFVCKDVERSSSGLMSRSPDLSVLSRKQLQPWGTEYFGAEGSSERSQKQPTRLAFPVFRCCIIRARTKQNYIHSKQPSKSKLILFFRIALQYLRKNKMLNQFWEITSESDLKILNISWAEYLLWPWKNWYLNYEDFSITFQFYCLQSFCKQ